jgi:flagellar basal-body rod protein FlgB
VGLFDITQIALDRAMTGAGVRQSVLANNVANANTPGFAPSDVDFHSVIRQALDGGTPVERAEFAPARSGNATDMDVEMASLSQNALDYETLAAVSRSRLQMLATVIGR